MFARQRRPMLRGLYSAPSRDGKMPWLFCRLVSHDAGTTVWHWDKEQGAAVVLLEVPDAPARVGATQKWQVADLVFEPQRGCGCQHPMYTFVPPAVT